MTVIDKILSEWSYRCSDGIVDMNNPTKRSILNAILEENGLDETELDEVNNVTYDDVIKNALNKANKLTPSGDIPQVKGTYDLGGKSVEGEDIDIFKILYTIAPPKKNQDIDAAGSKGTGHGEIALYWLFAHQPGHSASGNQGGGKPDLIVDNKGVEVKAYDSKSMGLGRIGSDKDNIDLLNTLFGLHSLVSTIDHKGKDKKASALNFSKVDIEQAFNTLQDFSNNDDLRKLTANYPLIDTIYNKVDNLLTQLSLSTPFTSEEASASLIKRILLKKLKEKPGFGGYIVNVKDNGILKYTLIDEESIKKINSKTIIDNVSINQGSVIINPENLFTYGTT